MILRHDSYYRINIRLIYFGGVFLELFLFILNILVILLSIAGGVLLIGLLYRGYILLGLLIAEKKRRITAQSQNQA
ncbi:hypothetical protein AOU00_20805 [Paenibacillus polymyxa]|nr:hypothetical protein AOU00_20805 [Paenibacillus polymyxa]KYG92805.1 hypothetical protein AZE31_02825 [Paenibacillus polymyxa]